jgi:hypothetical protein
MTNDLIERGAKTPGAVRNLASPGGIAVLEREIADLKEMNAHLQRRLEEVERNAEFQVRADRILAIPMPRDV